MDISNAEFNEITMNQRESNHQNALTDVIFIDYNFLFFNLLTFHRIFSIGPQSKNQRAPKRPRN
jgi:hypothetical protein